MAISGSCFCGAITYSIEGVLRDARFCHCSMCRKLFNAQSSAFALISSDDFSWVSGESLLSSFESKRGSGIKFCSQCGSTLCGTDKGEVIGVTLGCVDGDPEIETGIHIFVASKATWEVIPKDVTQFDEWPPQLRDRE